MIRRTLSRRARKAGVVFSTLALALATFTTGTHFAQAFPLNSASPTLNYLNNFDGFYTSPRIIPQAPGRILKTQDFHALLYSGGSSLKNYPVRGKRVMYTTTLSTGEIGITTGALMYPIAPWKGNTPAPVIIYATSTSGQGRQCAFSKTAGGFTAVTTGLDHRQGQDNQLLSIISNYESPNVIKLLARGFTVFTIDYNGMVDGIQTYMNNIEGGRAMLDGARAVRTLNNLPSNTPFGLWGFSQGGGASAVGASLHPSYAPDINLKVAYVGAPPVDLPATLSIIEGGALAGVIGYGVNGFVERYPEMKKLLDANVTEEGAKNLKRLANSCIADTLLQYPYENTSNWTKSGKSLSYFMQQYGVIRKIMKEQLDAAQHTPSANIVLYANPYDSVVPFRTVTTQLNTWCAGGANIHFHKVPYTAHNMIPLLTHMLPNYLIFDRMADEVEGLFSGTVHQKSCTTDTITLPIQ